MHLVHSFVLERSKTRRICPIASCTKSFVLYLLDLFCHLRSFPPFAEPHGLRPIMTYLSELGWKLCGDFQLNEAKTQGSKCSKMTASDTFESQTLKCKSRCKTSLPLEGLPSAKRLSTRTQTTLAFHISVVMQPSHIETVATVAFQGTIPPSVVLCWKP